MAPPFYRYYAWGIAAGLITWSIITDNLAPPEDGRRFFACVLLPYLCILICHVLRRYNDLKDKPISYRNVHDELWQSNLLRIEVKKPDCLNARVSTMPQYVIENISTAKKVKFLIFFGRICLNISLLFKRIYNFRSPVLQRGHQSSYEVEDWRVVMAEMFIVIYYIAEVFTLWCLHLRGSSYLWDMMRSLERLAGCSVFQFVPYMAQVENAKQACAELCNGRYSCCKFIFVVSFLVFVKFYMWMLVIMALCSKIRLFDTSMLGETPEDAVFSEFWLRLQTMDPGQINNTMLIGMFQFLNQLVSIWDREEIRVDAVLKVFIKDENEEIRRTYKQAVLLRVWERTHWNPMPVSTFNADDFMVWMAYMSSNSEPP